MTSDMVKLANISTACLSNAPRRLHKFILDVLLSRRDPCCLVDVRNAKELFGQRLGLACTIDPAGWIPFDSAMLRVVGARISSLADCE
jgi:hypothetical protein